MYCTWSTIQKKMYKKLHSAYPTHIFDEFMSLSGSPHISPKKKKKKKKKKRAHNSIIIIP